MREKVLVTGSDGFIATHLLEELKRRGYLVRRFDIWSDPAQDVRDPWAVSEAVQDCRFIIHTAASPYIPHCYVAPKLFFDTNAVGTLNLLIASKNLDIERFIYYSSSEIYGTAQQQKMNETHPLNPHSLYAVSKLAGDRLCYSFYREHGVPVTILRQFNCFGSHETHPYIIPEIIEQLNKNKGKLYLGNIGAERDFLYVEDAALACIDIMESDKMVGEVINIGSGISHSIESIARLIGRIMGFDDVEICVDKNRLRPYDVDKLVCDNSKIRRLIGWRPVTSFEDGLKRTIEWFHENGDKWNYRRGRT